MAHGKPGTQEVLDRHSLPSPPDPYPRLVPLRWGSSLHLPSTRGRGIPRTCQGLAGSPISALSKKAAEMLFP